MQKVWSKPHISKIYEALGAIGDKRIEQNKQNPNKARVYSSSRNKYYTVTYDPESKQIMSNDNTAYYTGQLSYPMIALLMLKKEVKFKRDLPKILSNIFWKEINQKYKNDYDSAINHVLEFLKEKENDIEYIQNEVKQIYEEVCKIRLGHLGNKVVPPKAY